MPPTFINPEPTAAISGQFELSGWWRRVGAQIVDQLVRLLFAAAVGVAGFVALADEPFSWSDAPLDSINEGAIDYGNTAADYNALWLLAVIFGLYFLSALVYAPAFMARWRGATPGKRMFGIRVVRADGSDLDFGAAFLREPIIKGLLVNGVGGIIGIVPLISYLWPLWDRECRAGHDFLAKTRVVKA